MSAKLPSAGVRAPPSHYERSTPPGVARNIERGEGVSTEVVPLTDHIVLKSVEEEERTASGLVIPDSAKEKPQHGHVVAVGPGKMNDAGVVETLELDEGDRVLYQKYTGQDITVENQEYIIIRFQDVLAKLVDGAPKRGRRK